MSYQKFILFILIPLSIGACKKKPKKSLAELPTKVETFKEDSYLKSALDSHTIEMIGKFGSIIDSQVFVQELDTIAAIIQQNKDVEIYHTATGLAYIVTKYGGGEYPEKGDVLQVQVETTTLSDKKIFSTSTLKQPLQFVLGTGQVVPAWDEIFPNVQAGSEFQIIAPSALSYGKKGYIKSVAPNTILKYDIKFEKIITPKTTNSKNAPNLKVKGEDKDEKYKIPATLKKPEKL